MVGGTWEEFLLTTWLTGIKYPVKITLCDTNIANTSNRNEEIISTYFEFVE